MFLIAVCKRSAHDPGFDIKNALSGFFTTPFYSVFHRNTI